MFGLCLAAIHSIHTDFFFVNVDLKLALENCKVSADNISIVLNLKIIKLLYTKFHVDPIMFKYNNPIFYAHVP